MLAGHMLRFEPRYAPSSRAIEAGEVGAVQAIRSRTDRVSSSDQQVLGGRTSIALYYGVHEFDLCRWYAGEVEAYLGDAQLRGAGGHGYPVEDLYSVGLRLRFRRPRHGDGRLVPPARHPGYGDRRFHSHRRAWCCCG